jgi:gamma-glutamyltranspeptidase/glutathione hydrolase
MLRNIVSAARQTPLGKALVVGVMCSFVAGCGSSIGPIDVPNAPSLGVPSLPGLGGSRRAATSGVFAAPGTDWGYVSAAGSDYAGLVVADEPRAALAARDALEEGGTAADAVTALFFTLTVTNPAAAGIGGGGVCLVHDQRSGVAQSIDFLPRAPAGGGPIAIPGAVRGFAHIQATYGTLPWNDLVDPAAVVAAGHPMSRTLARRLDFADTQFRGSPRLRRTLTNSGGVFIDEGEELVQSNLAGTIGILANRGPQDMYTGELAYRFVEEAAEDGGRITTIDMQSYRPNVTPAQVINLPGGTAYAPSESTGAGFFFPEMTQKTTRGLPQNPAPGTPPVAAIQAEAASVLAESGIAGGLPSDYGSTSFAVTDADGLTIACGVTMNGAFGTMDVGRSSGIIYARSPSDIEYGLSGAFLTPIIATDQGNRLALAAAGAGGPNASAALLYTAINARSAGLAQALENNGSQMTGTVNAISCNREAGDPDRVCRIGVDPRGSGMGAEARR